MGIDIFIIILTFLTAVPAILGTTDVNGKLNWTGKIAIILACGLGIGSYFKFVDDKSKEKEKDKQIADLQQVLELTKKNTDSTNITTSRIDAVTRKQTRELYPPFTMNLGKQEEKPIIVPLVKGMLVKILNHNSDNSLWLCYNGKKRKHVQDSDELIPILLEPDKVGCYFANESDMICTVNYQILGTTELLEESASKIGITSDDDSPAQEDYVSESEETTQPDASYNSSVPMPANKAATKNSVEKFFVSVGCYGSQEKEGKLRKIFKLDDSDIITVVKTGRCFRYLVGSGDDSFNEAKIRCNYIKRQNSDCIVMSFTYTNGIIVKWEELDE